MVGNENPQLGGRLNLKPKAARSICCTVSSRPPLRFGSRLAAGRNGFSLGLAQRLLRIDGPQVIAKASLQSVVQRQPEGLVRGSARSPHCPGKRPELAPKRGAQPAKEAETRQEERNETTQCRMRTTRFFGILPVAPAVFSVRLFRDGQARTDRPISQLMLAAAEGTQVRYIHVCMMSREAPW